MSNSPDLGERLKAHARKAEFRKLVRWLGLELMMRGDSVRFGRIAQKHPEALLAAALEEDARACALVARHYAGHALALLVDRVMSSDDIYAWRDLAASRPELAEDIQEKLLKLAVSRNVSSGAFNSFHFFESFLSEVSNTNPVPIQHWLATSDGSRLVDLTIRLPKRVSLFATVVLLMDKCTLNVGSSLACLCKALPAAVPIVQAYLPHVKNKDDVIIAICKEVPGIDLDAVEEFGLSNWDPFAQRYFCSQVVRPRGPLRDHLTVEHVMES